MKKIVLFSVISQGSVMYKVLMSVSNLEGNAVMFVVIKLSLP